MKKHPAIDWFIFAFTVILAVYMVCLGWSVISSDTKVKEHISLRR
jgi:hypothetical protein